MVKQTYPTLEDASSMKNPAREFDKGRMLPNVDWTSWLPEGAALRYPFQANKSQSAADESFANRWKAAQTVQKGLMEQQMAAGGAGGPGGTVNYQGPTTGEIAAFLEKQRNQEERMQFYNWVVRKLDLSDPAQAQMFDKMFPEIKQTQFAMVDQYADLAKQIQKIMIAGPASQDDYKYLWMIETGRIPQQIANLLSADRVGNQMWGNDVGMRYRAGMFTPGLWVGPGRANQQRFARTDPTVLQSTNENNPEGPPAARWAWDPNRGNANYNATFRPQLGTGTVDDNGNRQSAYPSLLNQAGSSNYFWPFWHTRGPAQQGVMNWNGGIPWYQQGLGWGGNPYRGGPGVAPPGPF